MVVLTLDEIQSEVIEKILRDYTEDNPEDRNSNIAYYIANKIKMFREEDLIV